MKKWLSRLHLAHHKHKRKVKQFLGINIALVLVLVLLSQFHFLTLRATYTKLADFGSRLVNESALSYPTKILFDSQGNKYVYDRDGQYQSSGIIKKYGSNGNFIKSIVPLGNGAAQVSYPTDFTIDKDDNIYVTSENGVIKKFDTNGGLLLTWTTQEYPNIQYQSQTVKAIGANASSTLYVIEGYTLVQYSSQGTFLASTTPIVDGAPSRLTFDKLGNVYVLASIAHYPVSKLDKDGNFIQNFGVSNNFLYYGDTDVAVDDNFNVYVTNEYALDQQTQAVTSNTVDKFSPEGTYISSFNVDASDPYSLSGAPYGITFGPDASLYVTNVNTRKIEKWDMQGNYLGEAVNNDQSYIDGGLNESTSFLVGKNDFVYTLDYGASRIQKFTKDGTFVSKFGSKGEANGEFNWNPYCYCNGFVVDKLSGEMYVFDNLSDGSGRIQKFDENGNFISRFGTSGEGQGQISYDTNGIAVDSSHNVYVLDGGDRIQKFNSNGNYLLTFDQPWYPDIQYPSISTGIQIDKDDNLYVIERQAKKIYKFDPTGHVVLSEALSEEGFQNGYIALAKIDEGNNMYVLNGGTKYIEKLDSTGTHVLSLQVDPENPDFSMTDFDTDKDGNIYVAEYQMGILVYDSSGTLLITLPDPETSIISVNKVTGDVYLTHDQRYLVSHYKNVIPDSTPPTVSFVSPDDASIIKGTTTISVTASDDTALSTVSLYQGSSFLFSTTSPTFSFIYDTRSSSGTVQFTAVAADAFLNYATTTRSFIIDNSISDISSPQVTEIATTTANVFFTTNNPGSTRIDYGPSTEYASSTSELDTGALTLSHSVSLLALSPCTLYHLRGVSRDVLGILAFSGDNTFTTVGCGGGEGDGSSTPPEPDVTAPSVAFTSPQESNIYGTTTVIITGSDETALSSLSLYIDDMLLGTNNSSPFSFALPTMLYEGNHILSAVAVDASSNVSTTTKSVSIRNDIQSIFSFITTPNETSVGATFSTDRLGLPTIAYGTTPAVYTSFVGTEDGVYRLSHTLTISNLSPCTTYYFLPTAHDLLGNVASGTESEVKTLGCAPAPVSSGGGGGGGGGGFFQSISSFLSSSKQKIGTKSDASSTDFVERTPPTPLGTKVIKPTVDSQTVPEIVSPQAINQVTRVLSEGSHGDDVLLIQKILKQKTKTFAKVESTGYMGSLTVKAVKEFQCAAKIVCSGDAKTTGYGVVGPKTKVKLFDK